VSVVIRNGDEEREMEVEMKSRMNVGTKPVRQLKSVNDPNFAASVYLASVLLLPHRSGATPL